MEQTTRSISHKHASIVQGKASLEKGTTKITGGTGAFYRLKASGVKFTVTPPSGGTTGTVAIEGVANYT
jgi:glycerol kinase